MGPFRIDAIKKAARREAWYSTDETDQTRTYNPFSRASTHRQRKQRDVENGNLNGLQHVRSENDVGPSPIETQRKADWQPNGGPQKAPTFPSGPSGAIPGRRAEDVEKNDDFIGSEETSKESSEKPLSNGSADEPNGIAERSVGGEGARNRKGGKFRKFLPWKHSGQDADIQRTDTSESKKSRKFKNKPTFMTMFKAVFFSWINILLIAAPVGIALELSLIHI